MTSEHQAMEANKRIVYRFIDECWNKGDLSSVNELVAANCRFHDPVFPHLPAGAENVRHHIEGCRRGFPDLKYTIDDTVAEHNEVVLHWTAFGTHNGTFLGIPPTNNKSYVTGTSIFRIEGQKIVEQWSNWNLMSLMEQLGVEATPKQMAGMPHQEAKVIV
jgi:steroid delta-isomerase-like uncharacterized protein